MQPNPKLVNAYVEMFTSKVTAHHPKEITRASVEHWASIYVSTPSSELYKTVVEKILSLTSVPPK